MSRWIYAELVHINTTFSFTIFYAKDRRPPRELGTQGDLFIRENGTQLFYKTAPERGSIDKRPVVFPARWRPVSTAEAGSTQAIKHLQNHRYRLTGTATRPSWMGSAAKQTTNLQTSTAMYCHFRNKKNRSVSPEL